MSWIVDSTLNWVQYFIIKLMSKGHVPKHIAFIMDGNRRFARRENAKTIEGHSKGFDKLAETLQWCHDLGVKEVTVYAFSIENFKRTDNEVEGLMDLARMKFKRLIEEKDKLNERGVRVRAVGNLELLPRDLINLIKEAMNITKNNDQAFLNVAFSYTSRDEMIQTSNILINGLNTNTIQPDDVNEELFTQCLYTAPSPPPELIIRTSGETRLSDFLLYQSENTILHFCKKLWPEFGAYDFIRAIFDYQLTYYNCVEGIEKTPKIKLTENGSSLVKNLHLKRNEYIENVQCLSQHGC